MGRLTLKETMELARLRPGATRPDEVLRVRREKHAKLHWIGAVAQGHPGFPPGLDKMLPGKEFRSLLQKHSSRACAFCARKFQETKK